jgi:ABC-2 type transport system permease protein
MYTIYAIAKKEWRSSFSTWWGWVFLTAMSFLSSWSFLAAVAEFRSAQEEARQAGGWSRLPSELGTFRNLTEGVIVPFFGVLSFLVLLFSAMFASRLLAEERQQRTLELLLTAPVRSIDIVIGKYLGGLSVVYFMLCLSIGYLVLLSVFGSSESGRALDFGVVMSAYLGLFLVAATSVALGLLVSAQTSSPLLAALVSAVLIFLWMLLRTALPADEPWRSVLRSLLIDAQLAPLLKGLVDLRAVAFFCSTSAFFLLLTYATLESHRLNPEAP